MLRLSGAGSGPILQRLAGALPAARRASLRRLRHPESGEVLDQALVLWLPGPATYTGEDCVELHLHGGPAVLRAVAEALVGCGARPAEPGEFSRRAVLQGRMDLTQAEGIADLIAAETDAQRRQALRQADGALAQLYGGWTARLAGILAHLEAAIEFAEDGLPTDLEQRAAEAAAALAEELRAHLADAGRGERLRDGLRVAILGAPNAGKSSLLNRLAERDAAIVSPQPGTTRDVIEVRLHIAGVPVTLADTAGLRDATDHIEAEGVRRAHATAGSADLVMAVFAGDRPADPATLALLGPDAIPVINKADLPAADLPPSLLGARPVHVSAVTGEGVARLRGRLEAEVVARAGLTEQATLTRPRHRAAIRETLGWLEEIDRAPLPELASDAARAALRSLGRITGRVGVEEVLDLVFGEFCIGK